MLEIISRVTEWAGDKEQAMAWYRAEPLPAFGGRTADALVKVGEAAAVRDYLDRMALGGFARGSLGHATELMIRVGPSTHHQVMAPLSEVRASFPKVRQHFIWV
jgi:hypothetical protein